MITVSTEAYISGPNAVITLPDVPEGQYEVTVMLRLKRKKSVVKKPRKAGFIHAKITMSADFNEPLEDFKDYM